MKTKYIIYALYIQLLLCIYSCGTIRHDKTSDFKEIISINDISGTYLNYRNAIEYEALLQRFKIKSDNVDFVTLDLLKPDMLVITCQNDLMEITDTLRGEIKGNYFEIYYNKKNIMAGVYNNVEIDRLRLGLNAQGELYIKHLSGETKSLLLVGYDSFGGERAYTYRRSTAYKDYSPFEIHNKWGYNDTENKVAIAPIFEYARIFEQGTARVKLDNKWGVIDKTTRWLIRPEYDYIGCLLDGSREAVLNGERGYINEKMEFHSYK